jgi:hypothetical protein
VPLYSPRSRSEDSVGYRAKTRRQRRSMRSSTSVACCFAARRDKRFGKSISMLVAASRSTPVRKRSVSACSTRSRVVRFRRVGRRSARSRSVTTFRGTTQTAQAQAIRLGEGSGMSLDAVFKPRRQAPEATEPIRGHDGATAVHRPSAAPAQ